MFPFLLVAALLIGFAGAWQTQEWRHDAAEKDRIEQQAKEAARRADKVDVAAVGHEKDKGAIRTEFLTITQEVERVVEKPFYVASEQCLDDDGLHQLTAAIGAHTAASEPARAVRGPVAPHWGQPRTDPEMERRDGAPVSGVPEPSSPHR